MVDASVQLSYNVPLVLQPCACFEDFTFFLIMSTVLSTFGCCPNKFGSDQLQRGNHFYSEIFHENLLVSSDRRCDFDMFNVNVDAVKAIKNRSKYTFISSDSKVKLNIKFPCSICYKNVNKNQKAIFCMTC